MICPSKWARPCSLVLVRAAVVNARAWCSYDGSDSDDSDWEGFLNAPDPGTANHRSLELCSQRSPSVVVRRNADIPTAAGRGGGDARALRGELERFECDHDEALRNGSSGC